jgi:hypothetical protein
MAVPNKVARKFNDLLGSEAADAMAGWMNGIEENSRQLRADIAELRQETAVHIAELRQDMNTRFEAINTRFSEQREEMRVGFANVDAKFAVMDAKFATMDAAASKRHADFMRWTLGFWAVSLVTLVGAIATLSRMLP